LAYLDWQKLTNLPLTDEQLELRNVWTSFFAW